MKNLLFLTALVAAFAVSNSADAHWRYGRYWGYPGYGYGYPGYRTYYSAPRYVATPSGRQLLRTGRASVLCSAGGDLSPGVLHVLLRRSRRLLLRLVSAAPLPSRRTPARGRFVRRSRQPARPILHRRAQLLFQTSPEDLSMRHVESTSLAIICFAVLAVHQVHGQGTSDCCGWLRTRRMRSPSFVSMICTRVRWEKPKGGPNSTRWGSCRGRPTSRPG